MTKLRLYNGEEVVEKGRTKKIDVAELKEDTKREGMNGISTRFIMKALDNALSDNVSGNCINPINVREALISMTKEADLRRRSAQAISRIPAGHAAQGISGLAGERDHARVRLLLSGAGGGAVPELPRPCRGLRQQDQGARSQYQGGAAADEGFLKSIEEQIAIIGSAADGFRQEVIAYLWATSRRGEKVSYRSYEPLKEAIEKKLMTSVRDISRIITKARTRDEEQGDKYSSMVKNLLENGYCESCVDVVLKYAANNLWKD